MNQSVNNLPPAKWQKTVTITKCDYIDKNVSIMVQNDWSTKCTGYKYDKNSKINIKKCQGPLCEHVTDYHNKLIEEVREAASK